MKCNIIRHSIYSCLSLPQLCSDKPSQSNMFRKYLCQPPLFLTMHISSAVKHIMMCRAAIKENWCVSLDALLVSWCSVVRKYTAGKVIVYRLEYRIFSLDVQRHNNTHPTVVKVWHKSPCSCMKLLSYLRLRKGEQTVHVFSACCRFDCKCLGNR